MDGGSGFMDTSIADTSTDSGRAVNTRRGQNCVPVMIKHLNRHGDNLVVWGMPAKLVTFVAILRRIEDVSTKVTFVFEDETGTIKGVKWLEVEQQTFDCPVNLNSYARVHGMIRNQNNETFVLVINIQPLEHLNELLAHLMEVTFVCLEGEKDAKSDNSFGNKTNTMDNSDVDNSGLNRDQAIVLNIIKNNNSEYGAERGEIKSKVPAHVAPKVDEILEFLSCEGHVYSTKTDDFFKTI